MHAEIQVALKFVISFLYNKLPRRRVNLFGEELEHALRDKFQGHWYPDKPFKGSAYRCLKITDPADPVLNRAARESGNPITDVIENLPADLAVWIDPGEVSYRMGEKGAVKILYSEKDNNINMEDINPEVRQFLSLDSILQSTSLNASMNTLSLSSHGHGGYGGSSPLQGPISPPLPGPQAPINALQGPMSPPLPGHAPPNQHQAPQASSPPHPFQARNPPVVYTAATFAQTKFGSTKLKTNSKKSNRMSPTEFSNYIKQRAMQKNMQQTASSPQNNFYKFYSQNGYPQPNNSTPTPPNVNYNNYAKGGSSCGGGNNDYGFGYNGPNHGYSNHTNNINNIADYSNLLSDWSDMDLDANAFLQDILSSAGVTGPSGGGVSGKGRGIGAFDTDWIGGGQGLNANQFPDGGLGPESRSSSTKSMSSGSDSMAAQQASDGFSQRVLVAN